MLILNLKLIFQHTEFFCWAKFLIEDCKSKGFPQIRCSSIEKSTQGWHLIPSSLIFLFVPLSLSLDVIGVDRGGGGAIHRRREPSNVFLEKQGFPQVFWRFLEIFQYFCSDRGVRSLNSHFFYLVEGSIQHYRSHSICHSHHKFQQLSRICFNSSNTFKTSSN